MDTTRFIVLLLVTTGRFDRGAAMLRTRQPNGHRPIEIRPMENTTTDEPPPHEMVAKMARYIVHTSDWTAMSTISTHEPIVGYPFANIFSVSDGPAQNSTGRPYFYLTDMEISVQDLNIDARTTITMSLAQTDFCKNHKYDPEDPLCAHVILTGTLVKVTEPHEKKFARKALFSRHPEMQGWPKDHGWWFGRLNITKICLLDYFGGVKNVDLSEYYATDPIDALPAHQ